MYRLSFFGGIALEGPSGPLSGRIGQKRQLALLSILAASGHMPATREKLIGVLWADMPEPKGRRFLSDTLYVIRHEMGEDAVLSVADRLRLNADHVWSDIGAFDEAIDGARWDVAVELYGGAFLDGFYLSSAEFERWTESQRTRFAERYHQALEQLAADAEAGDEWSTATGWWKRRAAEEPTNSRVALRLMDALVRAGNVGGALQHAREHQRLLSGELGVEPPPELSAFAARIAASADAPSPGAADHTERAHGRDHSAEREARSGASGHDARAQGGAREPTRGATADAPGGRRLDAQATPARADTTRGFRTHRKWLLRGLALVACTLIVAGAWLHRPDDGGAAGHADESSEPRASLAVLPLQNLSPDSNNAYFASALYEELLTQLTRVRPLKVIGPMSARGYIDSQMPPRKIAEELAVDHLVEGSVQVHGERLRVNIQMTDAGTGEIVWADRYDRTVDDVFAIQSDVAQRIVAAVGIALGGTERELLTQPPTQNEEAHRLYLQGRDYWIRPGYLRQNIEIAERFFERALTLEPGFGLARAALSQVHGMMYMFRYDPSAGRRVRQREEAEAALRLAPDLPQAHTAIALARYWGEDDYQGALEEFAVALDGLPNDAWLWTLVGAVHRRLGNWNDAVAAFERAAQLNPRDAFLYEDLGGNTFVAMRRYSDAVRAYRRAQDFAPDVPRTAILKGWAYVIWTGELDTLRAALGRVAVDANLEGNGPNHAQLLHWERRADSMLVVLKAARTPIYEGHFFFVPRELYAAWAHRLRDDTVAARRSFAAAVRTLDSALVELPADWRVHAARGLALAGLDRREEALLETRWLEQSAAYRNDSLLGPNIGIERARILAQLGEVDAAADEIKRLLAIPSRLSVPLLRLDPLWDPIREHPRFRRLLEPT